ncbi:MAG: hypothetical protein K1060chlam2_01184 [Chlamydiae bacterium]|nr:hypothetical protein [Chlamydiota bacterium]
MAQTITPDTEKSFMSFQEFIDREFHTSLSDHVLRVTESDLKALEISQRIINKKVNNTPTKFCGKDIKLDQTRMIDSSKLVIKKVKHLSCITL